MSKMDAQRAMREARYAANQKAAAGGTTARAGRPAARAATNSKAATSTTPAADVEACGHRSMNGRSCTRPAGHAEKNHRYG